MKQFDELSLLEIVDEVKDGDLIQIGSYNKNSIYKK